MNILSTEYLDSNNEITDLIWDRTIQYYWIRCASQNNVFDKVEQWANKNIILNNPDIW